MKSEKGVLLLLNKNNIKEHWMIISIIFLGLILRVYTIGDRSLGNFDELWQVNFYYSNSVRELILNAATHAQPPLDYLIGYFLMKIFPFSESIVRLPAVIFGTLTVYLVYLLSKELISKNTAIIASILTAISSHMIQYSQEARPYSIFIFFMVLTLYLHFKVLETNKKSLWIGFGISLYLLLLTRGFEPLVFIIVLNLLSFVFYKFSKMTIYTVITSMVSIILYLPFLNIVYKNLFHFSETSQSKIPLLNNIFYRFHDLPIIELLHTGYMLTRPIPLSILLFILTITGYYSILVQKDKSATKLFASFVLLMPLLHILSYTYMVNTDKIPFSTRYYIYVLPLLYIVISIGIEKVLGSLFKTQNKKGSLTLFSVFFIFIFFMFMLFNLYEYYTKNNKIDWHGASNYIKSTSPTDPIIVSDTPLLPYYGWKPHFEGKALYYKGVKDFNINELVDYAITSPDYNNDIFLVLYYWMPQDITDKGNILKRLGQKSHLQISSSRHVSCCNELCNTYFYHLCVYRVNSNSVKIIDRVENLLDKMIAEYPPNDSKVSLYLNRGHIAAARGDDNKALQYFDMARKYVPKKLKGQLEKEINRIL